jgi:CelD/BcsL family acetyltransferase involved in cellulose biosynthesis
VFDGDSLVGIVPAWATTSRGRYEQQLLGARLASSATPLAAAGREDDVAEALATALAGAPRAGAIRLEGQGGDPDWPERLAERWPGRQPWLHTTPCTPAPVVHLTGLDYRTWLAGKSANFRKQARKTRRRLQEAGARFIVGAPGEHERFIDAFMRLHEARWGDRGGSHALVPGLRAMLSDAARELVPKGRMRLYGLEVRDDLIGVDVMLAAGGEVSSWNAGFDERWADYSPGLQTLLFGMEDAMERGDRCLSLGAGGQEYKLRLADAHVELTTVTLVPRGPGYAATRLGLLPYQARWGLSRRLSRRTKRRLRRWMRR